MTENNGGPLSATILQNYIIDNFFCYYIIFFKDADNEMSSHGIINFSKEMLDISIFYSMYIKQL